MLLALIAAASLGSMPIEIDQQLWFRASRLPSTNRPYFGKGALTVDAAGKVAACRIVVASGVARLDAMICTMPLKLAVFHPAVDPGGRAVAAVVEQAFAMNMASPPQPPIPPVDFAVPISHIPEAATKPFAPLRIVTGADGKVASCVIIGPTGNRSLDQLACNQMEGVELPRIADAAGTTLRAMRDVQIAFIDAKSAPAPLP